MINIQTIGIHILAAEEVAPTGGQVLMQFLPLVFLGGAFYFFVIAPQRKLQKEREKLQSELAVGSEVILANGIYGKVYHIKDDRVTIELESGRMSVHKSAIVGKAEESDKVVQA